MNSFQKIILICAIVILLISLLFIGIAISKTTDSNWPPLVPICPDYWFVDVSGNSTKCVNVKDLGTCQPNSGDKHLIMDFSASPYVGANGNCAKYTWANNCNLAWDGINYGVSNPCATDSNVSQNSNTNTGSSQSIFGNFSNWLSSIFKDTKNYN